MHELKLCMVYVWLVVHMDSWVDSLYSPPDTHKIDFCFSWKHYCSIKLSAVPSIWDFSILTDEKNKTLKVF